MLQGLEIKRFKGIDYASFDVAKLISVIEGGNAKGKTTVLNAIAWVLTEKLFNDDGDINVASDSDVVKPINFTKGEEVNVTLIVNGTMYTKFLKELKSGGNKTDYRINNVLKSKADFYETLYEEFNYVPTLKKLKLDEVKLLTDPLYALQKLDSKILRLLLVALGCEVSEEEVIAMTEDYFITRELPNYKNKSILDKLYDMKKTIHKEKLDLAREVEVQEKVVANYATVEYVDNSELEELKAQEQVIYNKKYQLQNSCADTIELMKEIEMLTLKKKANEDALKKDIEIEIEKKKIQGKFLKDQRNNLYNDAATKKNNDLENLDKIIKVKNEILESYKRSIATLDSQKNDLERKKVVNKSEILKLTQKFDTLKYSIFENTQFVTCPHCSHSFDLNEDHKVEWEYNKEKELETLNAQIRELVLINENCDANIKSIDEKSLEISKQIIEVEKTIQEYRTERTACANVVVEYDSKLDGDIRTLASEVETLIARCNSIVDTETTQKINELNAQVELLESNFEQGVVGIKNKLNAELLEIEREIKEIYAKQALYKTKLDSEKKLENCQIALNDTEFHYENVCNLIHKTIAKVNALANQITGLNFVMTMENKTNEGYTDVCYVVDEKGVPFKDTNSADKLRIGMKFIERVKVLLNEKFEAPMSVLPILIDGVEKIESYDKIRELHNGQMICTRVTNDNNLNIKEI